MLKKERNIQKWDAFKKVLEKTKYPHIKFKRKKNWEDDNNEKYFHYEFFVPDVNNNGYVAVGFIRWYPNGEFKGFMNFQTEKVLIDFYRSFPVYNSDGSIYPINTYIEYFSRLYVMEKLNERFNNNQMKNIPKPKFLDKVFK